MALGMWKVGTFNQKRRGWKQEKAEARRTLVPYLQVRLPGCSCVYLPCEVLCRGERVGEKQRHLYRNHMRIHAFVNIRVHLRARVCAVSVRTKETFLRLCQGLVVGGHWSSRHEGDTARGVGGAA